jgi:hypothetical protein
MTVDEIREVDEVVFAETVGAGLRFVFDLRALEIDGRAAEVRAYRAWLDGLDLGASHPGSRQVLIAERPHETALSLLLATSAHPRHGFGVFSTPAAAFRWLKIPLDVLDAHADIVPP